MGWKEGGSNGEDLQGIVGCGLNPPTGTALQVPARFWGEGDANCFPEAPRIPSVQSQTDRQGLVREINKLQPPGPRGDTLKGWRGKQGLSSSGPGGAWGLV